MLGNAAVLAVLVLVALWLLGLQRSEIVWRDPGPQRVFGALGVVLAYAGFCRWLRRRRLRAAAALPAAIAGDTISVVYATQTGTAESLARRTAELLRDAGRGVRLLGLDQWDAQQAAGDVLFVVSTYGEGDPPDMAAGFARRSLDRTAPLAGLRYGLLALGDSEYVNFCGFGRRLDAWLRHQGAQALFDRIDVDNADAGALRHWQHQVGVLAGSTDQPDWSAPRYASWQLDRREQINPGSVGGGCYLIGLTAPAGEAAHWEAGDVAEIGPHHAPAEVLALLQRLRIDGDEVLADGETVAARLARSQWPDPPAPGALPLREWLDRLKPLPHREYSIASIPADGRLELLVRQWRREDGSLGTGSGWLTAHAAVGGTVDLRLRRNAQFHAPAGDCPLILIGNGTGIAGLRALLKARIAAGCRRNWLLFGERSRAHDFFFADEIQAWQAQGWLERVDLAFSRDQAQRIYVQDRLREAAAAVRDWTAAGACIYVCGRLQGMAPAVDAELRAALGTALLEQLAEQGRYRRDVY
nr:sulfite reductase subunit alpha [Tahibacter harae]